MSSLSCPTDLDTRKLREAVREIDVIARKP
jgi:hypothetical protein